MNIAKAPDKISEAMKEHELALAELYEVYAGKFPEYKDFWTKFSIEEIQHADWVNTLQTRVEESPDDFVVERFAIGAVEHSTEYIKKLANTARQSDLLLINALSTAVHLEQALIEKKFFEVFEGDICPNCGLTYWKCGNCGFLITAAIPPATCPQCKQKCNFLNVTCYTPECGGPGNIDPRL